MYQNNVAAFIEKYFMDDANLPFSFNYGGRASADILAGFEKTYEKKPSGRGTEHCISYLCKETGLRVTCELIEYGDFDAVEWALRFSNEGTENTPVVSDVLTMDITLPAKIRKGHPKFHPELHHYAGCTGSANDFEPKCTYLAWGIPYDFEPCNGRGSNKNMPYFTIHTDDCGVAMGIGWPGQWSAYFMRNEWTPTTVEESVVAKAGQQDSHFVIYPGEKLRQPSIAFLFYGGDYYDGQNMWRKFMRAHYQPKAFGQEMKPLFFECGSGYQPESLNDFDPFYAMYTDAKNEIKLLAKYMENGIKMDYWWQDAGWYACENNWMKLGTWEVNRERFPNGLREVSDYCHENGFKSIVWFEPETVAPGSWLYVNKPEWVAELEEGKGGLLRFDIEECAEWITDRIRQIIKDNNIDVYREDFNNNGLPYWRKLDAPDRRGISEIKFITAHLKFWDDLIAANNGMFIDNCAGGARRSDIESLKRSVPLMRTEYMGYSDSDQGQTYGMSLIIPYHGTGGSGQIDDYTVRSMMNPVLLLWLYGIDGPEHGPEYYAQIRKMVDEWRIISPIALNGDYYPLTPYSVTDNGYIAWQFHLSGGNSGGVDKGCVQAFRRSRCERIDAMHRLRGLDPAKTYIVENFDGGSEKMSGKQLLEDGLHVRIDEAPKAVTFYYYEA